MGEAGNDYTDFNPRSPRGERRDGVIPLAVGLIFQSTLPSRGATTGEDVYFDIQVTFQSTLPSRGATFVW